MDENVANVVDPGKSQRVEQDRGMTTAEGNGAGRGDYTASSSRSATSRGTVNPAIKLCKLSFLASMGVASFVLDTMPA